MDTLTLGEIAKSLAFVAGIITSVTLIGKYSLRYFHRLITRIVEDAVDPVKIQLSRVEDKLDENDVERCKSDLMIYISQYNSRRKMSDVQFEHMFKTYEHYRYDLHANSYIKNEMEKIIQKENERWQSITDR